MSTTFSERWIESIKNELNSIDYEKMFNHVMESKTYDRTGLRRLVMLAIFLADDKKLHNLIPLLSRYDEILRDHEYTLLLEEIQKIIITVNQIVKPETNVNRLYI
jgi:hypothetical protein